MHTKKILLLIIMIMCLLLFGCDSEKEYASCEIYGLNCETNDYYGSISTGEQKNTPVDTNTIYDILGTNKCYFFNEYNEFINFLDKYYLVINDRLKTKYTYDFFINKSLIIYLNVDSSSGYKYKMYFDIEEDTLELKIDRMINNKKNHQDVEINRLFFIDINKDEITDINRFEYLGCTNEN